MKDNPEPYSPRQLQFQNELAIAALAGKGLPLNFYKCHGKQRYNYYKSLMNMIIRHNTYKDKVENSILPSTHVIFCHREYEDHKYLYLVDVCGNKIVPNTVDTYRKITDSNYKGSMYFKYWWEVIWYMSYSGNRAMEHIKFFTQKRHTMEDSEILSWIYTMNIKSRYKINQIYTDKIEIEKL